MHCLVEPYAFIATLAGFFLRVPYIVTIHGSFGIKPFAHSLYGKIHKYGFSRARCVVAISNYSKRRISEYMQLRNVRVIPNGVNIAKFLDNDGHTTIKDPVLIGVGDVKHRKGYHLVVEALKDVKKIFPGAHYHIVGDQSDKKYVDHLHGKIKKYGLEENVSFHQHISDEELKDLYHKSRIFILTPISGKYDFEGFGLVYLEANASGLPVVGTHNSGGEDAINDGYNGFLTDPEDTTSIAQKIVTLLENDRLCDRMSQNGRIHARNLSWGMSSSSIWKFITMHSNDYQGYPFHHKRRFEAPEIIPNPVCGERFFH